MIRHMPWWTVCSPSERVNDGTLEAAGLHHIGAWDYGFRMLTNSVREVVASEVQKVACFEALGTILDVDSHAALRLRRDGNENDDCTEKSG
jgi:hypothetical protein